MTSQERLITRKQYNGFIAIIGFADPVTEAYHTQNQNLAYSAGEEIIKHGYGLAVGNFTGTFSYALVGAKHHRGTTLAVIETELWNCRRKHTDILVLTSNNHEKHQRLASMCQGGIVIGGGDRSLELINEFIHAKKPVVALSGSGGIVRGELPKSVYRAAGVVEAVGRISDKDLVF